MKLTPMARVADTYLTFAGLADIDVFPPKHLGTTGFVQSHRLAHGILLER